MLMTAWQRLWVLFGVWCEQRSFLTGHGSFLRHDQLSQVVESGVKIFVDSAFSLGLSVVGLWRCGS